MFVFEELARLFKEPCKIEEIDDYMHEHCDSWCERFCGIVDASKCWKKYMSVKEREKNEIQRLKTKV